MAVDPSNRYSVIRGLLVESFAIGLGDDDRRVRAQSHPIGNCDPPMVMVSLPYDGAAPVERSTEFGTFCTHEATWAALLVTGQPQRESSWELIEDWVTRLDLVMDLARKGEGWRKSDQPLTWRVEGSPQNIEWGSTTFLGLFVSVSAAIHLTPNKKE